jgi:hypothetical protein
MASVDPVGVDINLLAKIANGCVKLDVADPAVKLPQAYLEIELDLNTGFLVAEEAGEGLVKLLFLDLAACWLII